MIDYAKIQDGIEFYQKEGFKLVDVPWVVSQEASNITLPGGRRIARSFLGDHVGSAEQSFLELILRGQLKPGRYVSASACYRDERVFGAPDELHQDYFMKVELIDFLGADLTGAEEKRNEITEIAMDFFSRYISIDVIGTDDGLDIISLPHQIELGSYGIRSYKDFSWIYATGVAEPRLSQAIAKFPRSYHLADIPKGELGSASKIYEECQELKDSLKQNNPIMALNELADLYGTIDLFLHRQFPGLSMKDLATMSDATKRAFNSGRRK